MRRNVLIVWIGSCAVLGGGLAGSVLPRLQVPAAAQPGNNAPISDMVRLEERFEAVARRVSAAVVYVEAAKPATGTSAGKGRSLEESGSGILIRATNQPHPLVITNNHVIAEAAPEQITINLADGRIFHPGRVWSDPESDVAVLRIETVDNLPTASLGDSDRVRVGQWVLAIGSPFGLNQTVTHGIVSAKGRGQISLGNTIRIKDFIQTDAAINPGSSGGPLVNLDGEIIGLNTAIASHSGSNSGVAFSIPISLVKRVMGQLLAKGSVTRGYLGMQLVQSFDPADALKLGLDRIKGACVESVHPETPAAQAGLRPNDVVMQVDATVIRSENHLINLISEMPAGQKVRLQVWRDRHLVSLQAVVGDWTPEVQTRFQARP
jgi:S1-C subfamily serine protease